MIFIFSALLLHYSIPVNLYAQESGKIFGIVQEAASGDLLAGANCYLEVTALGASTNLDGECTEEMDGQSLLPALTSGKLNKRTLFWEYYGNRAAHDGRWKLVAAKKKAWELYDLDNYRTGLIDLSTEYPEQKQELLDAYERWAVKVGVE